VEATLGASTLQDLMLQAEILVQYGMPTKRWSGCREFRNCFRGRRTQRRSAAALPFRGRDAELCGVAAPGGAPVAVPASGAGGCDRRAFGGSAAEMRNVTRVAEITASCITRPRRQMVLTTAVNEIGGHWEVSRCVAAMRTPGSKPTAVQEFCGKGVKAGDSAAVKQVMCALQDLSLASPSSEPVIVADAQKSAELLAVRTAVVELGATSVLAFSSEVTARIRGSAGAVAQQAADVATDRCRGAEDTGRPDGNRAE